MASTNTRPPRLLALHVPSLPIQRLRRERGAPSRPLAVEHEGRILCADVAARASGVRAGQTVTEAIAACGQVELVPHAPAADLAALRALAEALLALVPAVEPVPPDAILLDAGAAQLLAGGGDPALAETRLAERALGLAQELGWSARAVVAAGKGPSLALARSTVVPVRRVSPGEEARALAPLPLAALGLDAVASERLAGLGIDSAGALAELPPESLAHRFGVQGLAAARLARGEDSRPLVPWSPETLPEEGFELE